MNRRHALLALTALTLAASACPGGGGESPTRLWLDAREGATPVLSLQQPPRY
jgi:hypothetical protein